MAIRMHDINLPATDTTIVHTVAQ